MGLQVMISMDQTPFPISSTTSCSSAEMAPYFHLYSSPDLPLISSTESLFLLTPLANLVRWNEEEEEEMVILFLAKLAVSILV
jgi:hypothetical protein